MDDLDSIYRDIPKVAVEAMYRGAGMVADAISELAMNVPTEPYHRVKEGEALRLPSPEEKAVMLDAAAGITHFKRVGDSIVCQIGFGAGDGYAEVPGGMNGNIKRLAPVPEIARAINHGTSFMQGFHFVERGIAATKDKAQNQIYDEIEAEINKHL